MMMINFFNTPQHTVTLNPEKIRENSKRISKIKPLINRYKRKGINYLSGKDDREKFEKNNSAIVLNVLYAKKEKYIHPVHISKHNSKREKDVILLMILNEEGRYCLAVKKLSSLLTGITSKPDLFRTKNKLESHKKLCENKDFRDVVMSSKDTKILEFTNTRTLIKHHLLLMQILNLRLKT